MQRIVCFLMLLHTFLAGVTPTGGASAQNIRDLKGADLREALERVRLAPAESDIEILLPMLRDRAEKAMSRTTGWEVALAEAYPLEAALVACFEKFGNPVSEVGREVVLRVFTDFLTSPGGNRGPWTLYVKVPDSREEDWIVERLHPLVNFNIEASSQRRSNEDLTQTLEIYRVFKYRNYYLFELGIAVRHRSGMPMLGGSIVRRFYSYDGVKLEKLNGATASAS